MKNQPVNGDSIAIAVIALALSGSVTAKATTPVQQGQVKCYGINSCKGRSQCKGAKNACKGQNSCRGQGWTTEDSDKICKIKGGKVSIFR